MLSIFIHIVKLLNYLINLLFFRFVTGYSYSGEMKIWKMAIFVHYDKLVYPTDGAEDSVRFDRPSEASDVQHQQLIVDRFH